MILVFGKTGQVSSALAAFDDVRLTGRDEADLSDPQACADHIATLRPDAVINAAAYTAVDKAETETELAHIVNADAPAAMAKVCAVLGIPLVHISTDYVFEGVGDAPYQPADATNPQGAYGATKLAGEHSIEASGCVYAILRTSWVFSETGANFVNTMLRVGATRDRLTVVADQIGGPTPADAIAQTCYGIAGGLINDPAKAGIYHFSGARDCSWAEFARAIFETAGIDCAVDDIPSSDYPTPAKRPLNSRMDCSATLDVFGIERPDWRAALGPIISKVRT